MRILKLPLVVLSEAEIEADAPTERPAQFWDGMNDEELRELVDDDRR